MGWHRDVEEEEAILKYHLPSDLQEYCILCTVSQVFRKHNCYTTLSGVSSTTQGTHKHIRLFLALCTAFPHSNLGSHGLPAALWPSLGTVKDTALGCWLWLTALFWGAMNLFTRVNKAPLCLRELRTLVNPFISSREDAQKVNNMSNHYGRLKEMPEVQTPVAVQSESRSFSKAMWYKQFICLLQPTSAGGSEQQSLVALSLCSYLEARLTEESWFLDRAGWRIKECSMESGVAKQRADTGKVTEMAKDL